MWNCSKFKYIIVVSLVSLVLTINKNGVLLETSPTLLPLTYNTYTGYNNVNFGSSGGPRGSMNCLMDRIFDVKCTTVTTTTKPSITGYLATPRIIYYPDNSTSSIPDLYEFFIKYNLSAVRSNIVLTDYTSSIIINPSSYNTFVFVLMQSRINNVHSYFPVYNTLINPIYNNSNKTTITAFNITTPIINSTEITASSSINSTTITASSSISSPLYLGVVKAETGYACKQGMYGGYSNMFNWFWTGAVLQAYVDGVFIINLCDYRIKENIKPTLPVFKCLIILIKISQ